MAKHNKKKKHIVSNSERWFRLNANIDHSGIGKHIKDSKKLMLRLEEIEDTFNENFPGEETRSKESFKFFTRANIVREVVKDDLIQLLKWISDPNQVTEMHQHVENFLQFGPNSVPKWFLDMNGYRGGYLRWDPDASIYIVCATRGWGKSYAFTAGRAVQKVLQDPYGANMVGSFKLQPQALDLLSLIKQYMFNPNLSLIYPELFTDDMSIYTTRGSTITKKVINIIKVTDDDFNAKSIRKDPSFKPISPSTEATSAHANRVFLDDIEVEQTTRNDEVVDKTNSWFDSLAGYRNHNSEFPFEYFITDTLWYQPGTLRHILDTREVKAVFAPGKWRDASRKIHRLSPVFTDDYLNGLKKDFGKWADSQIYMEGIPREEQQTLNLHFSLDRNVINMTAEEFDELARNTLHGQACDPATSHKNKKMGDAKSRFTITNFLMSADTTYIYDVYSSFGEDLNNSIAINAERALEHDIGFFTQDSHGTQLALAESTIKAINIALERRIIAYPHNNAAFTGSSQKEEMANEVLAQLFLNKNIVVVVTEKYKEGAKTIIDQLTREDRGMDIIDTIVYGELNVSKKGNREAVVRSDVIKRNARYARRREQDYVTMIEGVNYGDIIRRRDKAPIPRRRKAVQH